MQDVREMCPYWNREREARNDRRCECEGSIRCYPIAQATGEVYKGGVTERQEPRQTDRQRIW